MAEGRRRPAAGFSLIEMAIVVLIMGTLLAIGAAGFGHLTDGLALNGASQNIADRLRVTRDRAMATRTSQTVQFAAGTMGVDYRVEVGGTMQAGWKLPRRISYAWIAGTVNSFTLTPDGHSSVSGLIILQDPRGLRDTVSVLSSGLILRQ